MLLNAGMCIRQVTYKTAFVSPQGLSLCRSCSVEALYNPHRQAPDPPRSGARHRPSCAVILDVVDVGLHTGMLVRNSVGGRLHQITDVSGHPQPNLDGDHSQAPLLSGKPLFLSARSWSISPQNPTEFRSPAMLEVHAPSFAVANPPG